MLKEQINSAQMSDEHFAQRSNAIREEIESRQDQKQNLQEEERGLQEQLSEQQKKETESKVKLACITEPDW